MTSNIVTKWLQTPTTDLDAAEVESLVKTYPYFAPAHYMQAAQLHNHKDFSPRHLAHIRLYAGNWFLFHELMDRATGKKVITQPDQVVVPAPIETATLTTENIIKANNTADAAKPDVAETPSLPVKEVLPEEEVNYMKDTTATESQDESLIQPVFTEDYFRHEGIIVSDELPEEKEVTPPLMQAPEGIKDPRSLMVVMSFTEWLLYFRTKSQKEKEDEEDRKAMKTMWQKEKLAAALEEENDEIPENVFEMAVNSLDKDEGLVSESLAEILTKQGKIEKAIEMYRKLSLRNPQKSTYFAQQISILQKKSEL